MLPPLAFGSRPTPASSSIVWALDGMIWNAVLPHKAQLFSQAEGVNHRHAFLFRALKVNENVFVITDKKVSPRGFALAFPAHYSPQISLK